MAAINVNRAERTLTSVSFLTSAVLVVIGALLAQVMTERRSFVKLFVWVVGSWLLLWGCASGGHG